MSESALLDVVSWTEQRRGERSASRCAVPVSLVDLFPTFCAFADVAAPDDLDGIDMSAAVRGEASPTDRPIFCDVLTPRWGPGTEFRAIRWKQYKYVVFRDAPPLCFDLANDPGEQRNLITRGAVGEAQDALDYLVQVAADSIDFDAAELERIAGDSRATA